MRKYIAIPDTQTEALFIMSEYAFRMTLQLPTQPAPPYALWRGVEVEGELVSGAGLYPLSVLLKGAEIGLGGIGSVATWPQHRNRGHVAWLLTEMLREMREKKLWLSGLWPFDWSFYRKYGWELFTTVLSAEIKTSQLALLPKPTAGQGELLRADKSALCLVNARMAPNYQLMCLRTQDWLELALKPWSKPVTTWCWWEKGQINGYFCCAKEKDTILIHDIFWADMNAMLGMFQLLANHQAQAEKVKFLHLPMNHPLPLMLGDQYQQFRLKPLTMGRIVDVEQLLSALEWPDIDTRLTIQVADHYAPWNNGLFTLDFAAGRCLVSRGGRKPDLELGIQQLTQLVAGYADAKTLAACTKIAVYSKHQLLQQLFPLQTPFFTERF